MYALYILFMCYNEQILTLLCGSHLGGGEPLLEGGDAEATEEGTEMSELAEGEAAAGGGSPYKPSFDFMDSMAWRMMAAPFHFVFSFTMPTPPTTGDEEAVAAMGACTYVRTPRTLLHDALGGQGGLPCSLPVFQAHSLCPGAGWC